MAWVGAAVLVMVMSIGLGVWALVLLGIVRHQPPGWLERWRKRRRARAARLPERRDNIVFLQPRGAIRDRRLLG